jgi:hypothetical protein
MALLRRKTLVSFRWSELTFVERLECERLTQAAVHICVSLVSTGWLVPKARALQLSATYWARTSRALRSGKSTMLHFAGS